MTKIITISKCRPSSANTFSEVKQGSVFRGVQALLLATEIGRQEQVV